eukprot:11942597-Prorocentrum_lima.AAC.1
MESPGKSLNPAPQAGSPQIFAGSNSDGTADDVSIVSLPTEMSRYRYATTLSRDCHRSHCKGTSPR